MTTTIPARDWELTCHKCDGSGHVYVKHQVAERKTDIQEFKQECECCEGRGFVFAFQDIPGIEEYVKACRPAPAAGDALDAVRYRWVRDQTETDGIAIVMKNKHFDESRSCAENIDKFIDAALAAQRKGDA
ncbi:hypothetical protein [Achromobacter xylosoxidans]|uniref:hypothetical protein n=1 Tax=Alcaligenes xylosoxydans xylosoxydans TaxID=85698 RepID=UPI0004B079EF|nr:hypothetical protein [Achromobacter xylosoxidans]